MQRPMIIRQNAVTTLQVGALCVISHHLSRVSRGVWSHARYRGVHRHVLRLVAVAPPRPPRRSPSDTAAILLHYTTAVCTTPGTDRAQPTQLTDNRQRRGRSIAAVPYHRFVGDSSAIRARFCSRKRAIRSLFCGPTRGPYGTRPTHRGTPFTIPRA